MERRKCDVTALAAWTCSHFAVDFGCFVILFGMMKPVTGDLMTTTTAFLAYNILAFGLQPFMGQLCDEKAWCRSIAGPGGCALVALGLGLAAAAWMAGYTDGAFVSGGGRDGTLPGWIQALGWTAMVTAAVGNGFFHVGGGLYVLAHSDGRMKDSGIFVSSGAMGVALGTLLGSWGERIAYGDMAAAGHIVMFGLPIALLLVAAALILKTGVRQEQTGPADGEPEGIRPADGEPEGIRPADGGDLFRAAKPRPFPVLVGLLFFVIIVRAFAGSILPLSWNRGGLMILLPAAAACLGKAFGGLAADRLGAGRIGVGSLLLSLPLLCLCPGNMILSLAGILLFNMTMPITLCTMASIMPKNKGFAFGLTTLALLIGSGVTFFWMVPEKITIVLLALLIVISAVCIGVTTGNGGRDQEEKADEEWKGEGK